MRTTFLPALLAVALVATVVLPAAADKPQPTSVVAEEGVFGAAVSVDLRLAPIDVVEIQIETKRYGGPFEIVEARSTGVVRAGDTLIRFDPTEIDRQIERERIDLELASTKFEDAEVNYAQTMDKLRLGVEEAQRGERIAREELERWLKVERDLRIQEAEQGLEWSRDGIQNQEEELAQLEKMYQEDELTEETEEIVLRRTRRSLERSRRSLAFRETRHAWFLETVLPREDENLKTALAKAVLKLERETKTLELEKRAADLGRSKARLDLDAKKRALAELEEDREQMALKAPRDGMCVAGSFSGGKWQGIGEGETAYEAGDKVKANQVLYTLFTPDHLRLVGTVGQDDLDDVVAGQPVWFENSVAADEMFRAEVERVARFPRDDKYEVWMRLDRGDARFQAGQKVKATVLGKTAPVAVHVPVKAVAREGKKAWVHVATDEGFLWREVETGDTIGDRIAVKKGLAAGERVQAEAPKREAPPEAKKDGDEPKDGNAKDVDAKNGDAKDGGKPAEGTKGDEKPDGDAGAKDPK